MSSPSLLKCRYLAQFKLFKDFQQESSSNFSFLQFVIHHLTSLQSTLSEEIENRTKEAEKMKNRLAREIRLQLIDCMMMFNEGMVGKMADVFRSAGEQMRDISSNITQTIKINNIHFSKNQSFYDFYYSQLQCNLSTIDSLSLEIRRTNRSQIVKTKYFEIQGRTIPTNELSAYDMNRNQIGVQILNLERINERLRADSAVEGERLDASYGDLQRSLSEQLKEYEDRVIRLFSRLLEEVEPWMGSGKQGSAIGDSQGMGQGQSQSQGDRPANIVMDGGSIGLIQSPKLDPTSEDILHVPTFPGRQSLIYSNQQMDSLFFSKSVVNE